jgi:hypothetical protein
VKRIYTFIVAVLLVLAFSLAPAAPVLAAPVVASVTETEFGTNITAHDVSMPETVNAGDLLIVLFINRQDTTVTTPSNWTQLASNASGIGTDHVRVSVYYKVAVGTEGSTTVNFVTTVSAQAATQVYRITNWHGTTHPEISTAVTGNSTTPDPASLNPAGWGVEGTLWIAAAGQGQGGVTVTYPANYSNGYSTKSGTEVGLCTIHSARRVRAVASEDPGTFTIAATNPWVAFTIAVRPALYKLTMAVSPSGSGTATDLTNASPYEAGTAVNIATVANQGYRFVNWTAPAGVFGNADAAATTFTMPAQNVTATANFVAVYSLAMAVSPVDSGTATDLNNASPYEAGTAVNITAIPAAGYRFANWTAPAGVFGNVTGAATNFTMPAQNVTVTASFQKLPTVTTETVTNITPYSAIVNMSYNGGTLSSVEVRFACKRADDQASFYTSWVSTAGNGTYTEKLTGLASKTNYVVKSQLRYDGTVIEGATRPFTTAPGASPGFCFIATAAYGTPTAEQIDVLQEFRDVVLLKSAVGSQFVALYYHLSPPVADFIARSDLSRTLVRELLVDPIIWAVEATGDIWRN